MPRIKITEAPRPIDGEGDIMLNMSYQSLLDQTLGYGIKITKLTPITFTTNLSPTQSVATGAALTMTVAVTGGKTPYTYVWKKGGVVVSGQTTATFNKASAASGDAGSYVCEVTDADGRTVSSVACLVNVT